MKTLIKHRRIAAARFTPGRALVAAMLLGPIVGALLAFGGLEFGLLLGEAGLLLFMRVQTLGQ